MKTQFDTEGETESALNDARLVSLGWCPVIKELCREDCICYYEGSVRKDILKEKWTVCYPNCQHTLISGEISTSCEY